MQRVKERWDQKYPENQQASWQKLRDNAVRFKKEPEQLQDQEQQQEEEEEQTDFEKVNVNQVNNTEEQAGNNIDEADRIKLPREELTEEDQNLKAMFITQLESLTHSSLLQIESREKLSRARFDNQLKESEDRLLHMYLKDVETIPEICAKVYAMGRAIGLEIIKELRVLTEKDTTNYNLRNAKEQWLEKLRYKKIKLAKCEEKRRRKQDNIIFQQDQKGFFRTLE